MAIYRACLCHIKSSITFTIFTWRRRRVLATRAIHLTSQDAPSGPLLPYIIGNHAQYHTLTIFASGSTAT